MTLGFGAGRLYLDVTAEVPVTVYPAGERPDPARTAGAQGRTFPVFTRRGVTPAAGPHHGPRPGGTWPAPARPPHHRRQTPAAARGKSLAPTARNTQAHDTPSRTYELVH